jgi:hypothetical protein
MSIRRFLSGLSKSEVITFVLPTLQFKLMYFLLYGISTVNQPDAPVSQIYLFLFNTLHVSDGLSVHHQEFKTLLLSAC